MINKLLFVINPTAGGSDKKDAIETIKKICIEKKVGYKIVQTSGRKDEEFIAKTILSEEPDAVIACGGDGTVNMVGRLLFEKAIPIGIIPMGSANGLATGMMISDDIEERIDSFLKNKTTSMDVLKVNGKYYAFHLCSVGLNAKLIAEREKTRRKGMWGYFLSFFKIFHIARSGKFKIATDTENIRTRADMIIFANGDRFGTGAIINPSGKIDDGKFEICIFKPFPWYAFFDLALKSLTGQIKVSPYTKYIQATRATIITPKPELLEVDGDVKGRFEKITLEIMAGAVKVLI